MNPEVLVSVIVPTYNRRDIVGEAIQSILGQTYASIETVVVDDGSTDDTLEILRSFGGRIRVISQANAGPAAARNRGIEQSRGEILMFLDSDDLWLPTYVERQVSLLQRAGASVPCSLCNGWLEFADGRRVGAFQYTGLQAAREEGLWQNPDEIFATRFLQFNQMAAIRRAAFEKVGGFDARLKYLEDWDLALRLSLQRPWCFIREPLVVWRQRATDSLSHVVRKDELLLRQGVVEVRERAMSRLGVSHGGSARLPQLMRKGLAHNRRELLIARIGRRGRLGRLLAKVLKRGERYREAFWSHTPSFPRMQVVPLDSGQGACPPVFSGCPSVVSTDLPR